MPPLAIYPGSFDPVTRGHLNLIERAARLFARLRVVVGDNPNKQTMFTLDERMRFVREATAALGNVEVDSFSRELLVSYARRVGATVVVRGLRTQADFESEFRQSQMNQRMMAELETVFLFSEAEDRFVSSSLVRDAMRAGQAWEALVPEAVRVMR